MIWTDKQPIPEGFKFLRYIEAGDDWAVEIARIGDEEAEMRAALGVE